MYMQTLWWVLLTHEFNLTSPAQRSAFNVIVHIHGFMLFQRHYLIIIIHLCHSARAVSIKLLAGGETPSTFRSPLLPCYTFTFYGLGMILQNADIQFIVHSQQHTVPSRILNHKNVEFECMCVYIYHIKLNIVVFVFPDMFFCYFPLPLPHTHFAH